MIYRDEKRKLPVLEELRIASPCTQSWNDMLGNERVRFCKGCGQNVYDLSAVTRMEAETFLLQAARACVRLYRRADGTILGADCPSGRRRARGRRAAWVLAIAGLASGALSSIAFATPRPPGEPRRIDPTGSPRVLKARAEPPVVMGMVGYWSE